MYKSSYNLGSKVFPELPFNCFLCALQVSGFHVSINKLKIVQIVIGVFLTCIGTFCGVFRRQALDRGAVALKVDKIVTGWNRCHD